MKTANRCFVSWLRLLFGALAVVLVMSSSAWATTRWATLEAIHKLENPRNLPRPGPKGELGAYQFRSSTWRMHTKTPFYRAIERQESDVVAVKHYEWLKRGLEQAGLPATTYSIALAWNGGLSAAINVSGLAGSKRVTSGRSCLARSGTFVRMPSTTHLASS